jgi:hypothetical protein
MQNVVNNKVDAVITLSSGISANIQNASQDISSLRADFSTVEDDLRLLRSTLDPGLQAIIQRIDHLSGQVAMMRVSPATSGAILQSTVRMSSSLVVELHLTDKRIYRPVRSNNNSLPSQVYSTSSATKHKGRISPRNRISLLKELSHLLVLVAISNPATSPGNRFSPSSIREAQTMESTVPYT